MKFINKKTATYALPLIALTIVATLLGNSARNKHNVPYSQIPYCAVSPLTPTAVEFAGENISLTRMDRRERMDREILAFTYSHINTLLQIKRANRLFPIVEPILRECGVPDDFKYLMIIESNGDIFARSTVGAGGLWQFMEKTARQYGLEVNSYIDERFHIEKATRAACDYLKESYKLYGDWLTVAASYNAGRAGISRRIEKQQENRAINLQLVPETSRYLFRLLAAKAIFTDPINYGFIIQHRDLYPPLPIARTITMNATDICWPVVAKEHGLTFLQLREANPWITEVELPNRSGKEYHVIIPDSAGLHYNPEATEAHNRDWVIR